MNIDYADFLLGWFLLIACIIIRLFLCFCEPACKFLRYYVAPIGVEFLGFIGGWWFFVHCNNHWTDIYGKNFKGLTADEQGFSFIIPAGLIYLISLSVANTLRHLNESEKESVKENPLTKRPDNKQ